VELSRTGVLKLNTSSVLVEARSGDELEQTEHRALGERLRGSG